ncbi:MAG: UDP binding domain-containing protein [Candidatus Bathyarchaeia archaeon]|jgi:nucleotide sugar dehydrogenase
MPAVLNLKPEDIDTIEKRSKYTISVIGCGQNGILLATAFADAGFKVICTDENLSVIKKVTRGKTSFTGPEIEGKLKGLINSGQLNVTSELKKAVTQSDIIIITVGVKVDSRKKIDYSDAVASCKQVAAALRAGTLVIYCNIAAFGFNEGIMKETFENTSGLKVGQDFGLAYIPLQTSDAKYASQISNLELKVAVTGKTNIEAVTNILKKITKNVKEINDVKTAEIATLFTVARKDASRALANELAVFCENAHIDYFEVLKLLDVNDPSFWPTTVEEENKNEAYLLLESAENLNAKLRLPALSRQINEDMIKHAVNLTQDALRACNKTLRRARVAVMGTVNQPTGIFVRMLELKGAKVSLYDPLSKRESLDLGVVKSRNLNETVEGTDCIVILTGEDQFKNLNLKKLKALAKTPAVIVDLAGVFEPKKVEAEGFIYRGLGRGTD